METQLQTILERTLSGYSQGFHVSHIATFELETCSPKEEAQNVFDRLPAFDQIPVQDGERIIGVLERGNVNPHSHVIACMCTLDDSFLVSADETLSNFLPLLAKPPYYRLVLQGVRINGIVTRSDALKLPVRLYVFALVTHLELLMKEIIILKLPRDSDWMSLLSEGRQDKINTKKEEYAKEKLDPPLVELTDFCDKHTVLSRHLKLPKNFSNDLSKIEKAIRNPLAHAANFAPDDAKLQEFINMLGNTQYWTHELNQYLN